MPIETLRGAAKDFLIPGSLPFVLLGLFVGVVLLFFPTPAARWGRRWLVALFGLHLVLSLQGVSDLLIRGLSHEFRPLESRDQAHGARVVVVLGNGTIRINLQRRAIDILNVQSAYNVLEASRLHDLLGDPLMLTSGGPPEETGSESLALATALEHLGVSHDRIVLEDRSMNTYLQGVNVSKWLRANGETSFVLVTTPEHMRRAVGVFAAHGLHPIPSPSAIDYGGPPFWRPSGYALQGSKNALYEYLAWGFYRLRGWL